MSQWFGFPKRRWLFRGKGNANLRSQVRISDVGFRHSDTEIIPDIPNPMSGHHERNMGLACWDSDLCVGGSMFGSRIRICAVTFRCSKFDLGGEWEVGFGASHFGQGRPMRRPKTNLETRGNESQAGLPKLGVRGRGVNCRGLLRWPRANVSCCPNARHAHLGDLPCRMWVCYAAQRQEHSPDLVVFVCARR